MAMMWSLVVLVVVASADAVNYSGHQVLRCIPTSEAEVHALKFLELETPNIDVWKPASRVRSPVDIRVPPFTPSIPHFLRHWNISCDVMVTDVQETMNRQVAVSSGADFDYANYHKMEEIDSWIDDIAMEYPDLLDIIQLGKSYEERPMRGFVLTDHSVSAEKTAVWIEGGIHAREWISPATVIWMVKQLCEEFSSNNTETKELLQKMEIHVLPVYNVDGYAYTWAGDRMWRKTRSDNSPDICKGTDPNRNWDFHWGEEGCSHNECSETYCGNRANSEVEIQQVTKYLSERNFKGFIDFHSYSQLWMSPWGYTTDLPKDFVAQDALSAESVKALTAVHGTQYEHGSIARVIYKASGSSADWAYGVPGIKFSYAVELRDTGAHGFLLPADQIVPSGEETLAALKVFANGALKDQ